MDRRVQRLVLSRVERAWTSNLSQNALAGEAGEMEECADVFIYLCLVVARMGEGSYQFTRAIKRKIEKNAERMMEKGKVHEANLFYERMAKAMRK